ncbi:MAG: sigma-70 family RNA polymerase sigma factor [Acidobacteria bacterium]|nr:sigma-70 family RNA polymerase sigma factor [Acidobacteriota bacterium]
MPGEITAKLSQLRPGDRTNWTAVMPQVYSELRRLASAHLRREQSGFALQPTELVHETFLRLIRQHRVEWQNRGHFFGVAAQLMHLVLLDWVRRNKRLKRGGPEAVQIDLHDLKSPASPAETGALKEALHHLAQLDPRQAQIVQLRYFRGLTVEETAQELGISEKTVRRDWIMARAWLHAELSDEEHEP